MGGESVLENELWTCFAWLVSLPPSLPLVLPSFTLFIPSPSLSPTLPYLTSLLSSLPPSFSTFPSSLTFCSSFPHILPSLPSLPTFPSLTSSLLSNPSFPSLTPHLPFLTFHFPSLLTLPFPHSSPPLPSPRRLLLRAWQGARHPPRVPWTAHDLRVRANKAKLYREL